MAFTITGLSPAIFSGKGGFRLEINGSFELGNRYSAYIGEAGSDIDPTCYSGIPGQGDIVYPITASKLVVYSPLLFPSDPTYHLAVMNMDTMEAHVLFDVVTVTKEQFYSLVYDIRKPLPPNYWTGPRNIEFEDPTT